MARSSKMASSDDLLQACFYLVVLLVTAFLSHHFLKAKKVKYPPLIRGWIPWLGCAIDFGEEPLKFIKESMQKHGAIFTLYIVGQRMTFLTETSDLPLFFNSPQADFQQAAEEAVRKTSGMSSKDFFAHHREIHDLIKGRLSSSNLHKLAPKVGRKLDEYISANIEGTEVDLMGVVRNMVFNAVIPTLFGDGVLPKTRQEIEHFQKQFAQFDGSFEHGAKLPEFLVKEWAKSKYFLLNWFYQVLKMKSSLKVKEDTLLQSVVNSLEESCAPKYATLLLWASLANAVPVTFWTLAFVLSDQAIKKDVIKEADEVLGPYFTDESEWIKSVVMITMTMTMTMMINDVDDDYDGDGGDDDDGDTRLNIAHLVIKVKLK